MCMYVCMYVWLHVYMYIFMYVCVRARVMFLKIVLHNYKGPGPQMTGIT